MNDDRQAPPQFSDDGLWFWNGRDWVPADQAPWPRDERPTPSTSTEPVAEIRTPAPRASRLPKSKDSRPGPDTRAFVGLAFVTMLLVGGGVVGAKMLGDEQGPDDALRSWMTAISEGDADTFCALSDMPADSENRCREQIEQVAPLLKASDFDLDDVDIEVVDQDSDSARLRVEDGAEEFEVPMRRVDGTWKVTVDQQQLR